jgi:hypothetical protein
MHYLIQCVKTFLGWVMPHAFGAIGDNKPIFNESGALVIELTHPQDDRALKHSDDLRSAWGEQFGRAAHAIERADRFRKIIERVETFSSTFSHLTNASSARNYCRFEKLVGSMK